MVDSCWSLRLGKMWSLQLKKSAFGHQKAQPGCAPRAPRHFSWQEAQSTRSCRLPFTRLPSLWAFVSILPLPGDLAEAWATFSERGDSGHGLWSLAAGCKPQL